jgi:response regulator RpfG family c-di-GMP phosphodiesterase
MEFTKDRLNNIRSKLLHLHKTLMEYERASYEQIYGRVEPAELLRLLIQNEQFAWLHTISELIVRIDEIVDAKEPATGEELKSVGEAVEKLLRPAEIGEEFAAKYQNALQQDPDVVMAHKEVRDALK